MPGGKVAGMGLFSNALHLKYYFLVVKIVYRTKKTAVVIHDTKKMYRYKSEFFLIFNYGLLNDSLSMFHSQHYQFVLSNNHTTKVCGQTEQTSLPKLGTGIAQSV